MFSSAFSAYLLAAGCVPLLARAASLPAILPRASVPGQCNFSDGHETDFGYSDQSDAAGRSVCVGWGLGTPSCGPWTGEHLKDAISAVSQQLTQDGQFKSTKVGIWLATFDVFTTAFPNTDPIFFDHGFDDAQKSNVAGGAGALTYYYRDEKYSLTLNADHC